VRDCAHHTSLQALNQVVVWDRIITRKEDATFNETGIHSEYVLADQGYNLKYVSFESVVAIANTYTIQREGCEILRRLGCDADHGILVSQRIAARAGQNAHRLFEVKRSSFEPTRCVVLVDFSDNFRVSSHSSSAISFARLPLMLKPFSFSCA
jgi:hypothetical protein